MPNTAPDLARRVTGQLSCFLSSPDGTAALARMQLLQRKVTRSAALLRPVPTSGRAGVWHLQDGDLRRDPGLRDEWRYWADQDLISLAPGRRRVAVLGESAARGYFFDPAYSLGSLIQAGVGNSADVLDLARTNCSLEQLLQTAANACGIGADALVVYAGNNWNNVDPTPVECHELAALFSDGGFPAAAAGFRRIVTEVAESALDLLRSIAGQVPVILIVPEFNLGDWADEPALDCPVLPAGRILQWNQLRADAERSLAFGELKRASARAAEMIGLDGGCSPVSHRLAAACAATPAEATVALRAARDSVVSPGAFHSPRTLTSVQEVMRRKGRELGFQVIDQGTRFREREETSPGRRFFLDYCHLTFEGLASTARAVLDELSDIPELGTEPDRDRIPPRPAPDRLALAHFLAAVHNAHYGQPAELLRHHLTLALDTDASIAKHIENYLDYQARLAPNWICTSYEHSAREPAFRRYMVVGDGRLNGKLADHTLRDIMVEELERRGVRVRARYEDLLVAEHGNRVDLMADASLAATFNERRQATVGQPTAYYRASSRRTQAFLIVDEPAPLAISLTWRLPAAASRSSQVTLAVNGHPVGSAAAGPSWATERFIVDPALLNRGRNTVELLWPEGGDGNDSITTTADAYIERGQMVLSHPVYGHVHDWQVTPTAATRV